MDITVRKAQVQDIPGILKMNEEFNEVSSTVEAMKASLENNKNELVFVAVHNEAAVGFVCGQMYKSICYPESVQGEITELFVCENYRRSGAATKLVQHIEIEFAKNNVSEVILKTGIDNEKARRFYENCRYEDYEEVVYVKEIVSRT